MVGAAALGVAGAGVAGGQEVGGGDVAAGVRLDFAEGVELRTLVDYASRRLGLNVVYDDALSAEGNRVTIRSPGGLPADGLLPFLEGVLRMKGFALVDGEAPGWKRVVAIDGEAGGGPTAVRFVPLAHAEAQRAAAQVRQLLAAAHPPGDGGRGYEVSHDARTNQVGVIGPPEVVEDAAEILARLDVEVPREREPVRFYKLTNATAADVLDTIRALHGQPPLGRTTPRDSAARPADGPYRDAPGLGRFDDALPDAGRFPAAGTSFNDTGLTPAPTAGDFGVDEDDYAPRSLEIGNPLGGGNGLPGVAADPNTNTIIVMGGPEVQQKYEQLIAALDKRRPQVLLEATVVTLDTSDNYRFGVEIAARGTDDDARLFTFSQFGLSEADPATGRLTIDPGLGFNGAIVGSDVAEVIVQALQSNRNARVRSAPRVLVNDNATGTLASIAEQPFASVNASDTVATTSFGGYAQAGTTITLTPHISEGDYLQLEYAVELSNFTGPAADAFSTPPPRQTNRIESRVTIPDGSTIIVGGVNLEQLNDEVDAVPILGQIPILKYLFSSRSESYASTTLFVFLRPVILRDDRFLDLRDLSEADLRDAGLPGNLPASEPMIVR